jgi:hypothetical protein
MQMKNQKANWQLGRHKKTHETLSNKLSNKLNGKKRKIRGVDGCSSQIFVGCAKVFIFYIGSNSSKMPFSHRLEV